jgi:hypothetical protein
MRGSPLGRAGRRFRPVCPSLRMNPTNDIYNCVNLGRISRPASMRPRSIGPAGGRLTGRLNGGHKLSGPLMVQALKREKVNPAWPVRDRFQTDLEG